VHSLISMIGDTAATPTSAAGRAGRIRRQLERQMPAERVAGDADGRNPSTRINSSTTCAASAVSRSGRVLRRVLGVAAIALVQSHDVHAARKGLAARPRM